MSKASMRSAAQDLVQTLQVQLERERQQKRKLQEHLEKIEESQRMWDTGLTVRRIDYIFS